MMQNITSVSTENSLAMRIHKVGVQNKRMPHRRVYEALSLQGRKSGMLCLPLSNHQTLTTRYFDLLTEKRCRVPCHVSVTVLTVTAISDKFYAPLSLLCYIGGIIHFPLRLHMVFKQ